MGFKKMDSSLGFADFALASSLKHNRSLKLMEKLDKSITEIVLVRDVVVLEETYAKSAIIKDDETSRALRTTCKGTIRQSQPT